MSGPSPKAKKSSPISGLKSGPLKATLPVASLVRSDHAGNKATSPSCALQKRFSPDRSFSGQRSPGSLSHKGFRSKGTSSIAGSPSIGSMRRTASLDTIHLKGQWPAEAFFMNLGRLQVNKATQTDDGWVDQRKMRQTESSSSEDLKLEKYVRHRLRTGKTQTLRLVSPPMLGDHSVTPPFSGRDAVQSPVQPFIVGLLGRASPARPPIRSSLEGLNQEIERLVLKDFDEKTIYTYGSIPEGHRAPLAEMLRHTTRSVNTQTPGGHDDVDTDLGSSGPPSRGSLSPQYQMDLPQGSCGSSPDEPARMGTSPHINRFLAREPPDGCEKVSLRLEEVRRAVGAELPLLKPITTGLFKPSLGSAFQPLQNAFIDSALLNGECSQVRTPSPHLSE